MIHLVFALLIQCPDGAPPPCARAAARSAAVPDSNRIAILPFRIAAADSLLSEGVAELLANEFTGGTGPQAVHMGTVIRAWQRAGGNTRTPLPQAIEIRVATEVGAGMLVDGSIVGLGPRLTFSAAVTWVRSGRTRRIDPVSGHADSLPALVERVAASLLTASTGQQRTAGPTPRLSDSPPAIRAYFAGLAYFRRGHFGQAAGAFEQAFAADTMFARAAYMRWLTSTWGPGFGTSQVWSARARGLKSRLSIQDQIVVDASFGTIADRERAAITAPQSAEVFYLIGDNYYHAARARGWETAIARARAAFERSLELDSQATSLHHLVEIGLWTSDTALLRSVWPAYDRFSGQTNPGLGWLVANRTGDMHLLDALRRREMQSADSSVPYPVLIFGPAAGASAALIDEAYQRIVASIPPAAPPVVRAEVRAVYFLTLGQQGRPAAAAAVAADGPVGFAEGEWTGMSPDIWFASSAALGDGDRSLGAASVARLRTLVSRDTNAVARARCAVALWDALVEAREVADDPAISRGQRRCAAALRVIAAQRAGTLDSASLAAVDSVIVSNGVGAILFPYSSIGPILLGRAWESVGSPRRALVRARAGSVGFADLSMATRRRNEGRLAALVGDTTGAIRAYREYLDIRRDAEPVLIPQRDSVRAELAKLLRPRS